ncbi:MAG TPA: hypothetical protein VMU00_08015 [Steroidobacteraceae bacterium]|nr:hypothetical protein [Steroidobacteraceae bacterium]
MAARRRPGRGLALAALLGATLAVLAYDAVLSSYRYPYSGDSASYIDMAGALLREGRPLVTPWDVDPGDRDAVPQPLFPPGFPALIAALTPLTGDVRTAALVPGRVAAALLPFLIVVLFRGAVADGALAAVAALALLSQGVRDWHFLAYSDVPALALAVLALGLLARGLGLAGGAGPRAAGALALAGLAAGIGYTVRNAGLAVLAASLATLGYARLRGLGPRRAPLYWLAGASAPLAALIAYNLATFGRLQPYDMPQSTRRWPLNLGDYAVAQLDDLGLPDRLLALLPPWLAVLSIAAVAALFAAAFWRLRREPARQGLVVLLGGYCGAGALLLVASRSRYEWGNFIDSRNVLQYTFAYGLGLAVAAGALCGPRGRRYAALAGALLLVSLLAAAVRDVHAARGYHQETWLALSEDRAVMSAARELPANALIASNAAVLFRLGVPRPVRELELGGGDDDFVVELGALTRAAAGRRPTAFLLVCDEWTTGFSACGARPRSAAAGPACTRVRGQPPLVLLCEAPPAAGVREPAPGREPAR